MSFKVESGAGNREAFLKLDNITEDMKEGIREGFEELGSNLVRTGENQALNEPKFGREYRVKVEGVQRLHRASAPGQSPAIITGNYFESFGYEGRSWKELEFGNTAEYAEFLELGTDNMEPRPGVLNSVNKNIGNATVYLNEAIDRNVKK